MTEFSYDWTQFKREIFIKADLSTVFQAWAKPGELTKWFIAEATAVSPSTQLRPANEIMQPGDHYHWQWHQDLETEGTILDVVENETLQFTFGNKAPDSDEKIIVTVNFAALENATSVSLKQENMPDSERGHVHWHMGCNMGWSFFMTNLKALLEYGADLRETESERAYASRAITQ